MKNLLYKEFKLTGALITYLFIAFTTMVFIPNYPILVSTFFIGMGIFYSFQFAREHNDTLYTALLPVKKSDVVKARYFFVGAIELACFLLFSIFAIIRIFIFSKFPDFANSPLLIANVTFLGCVLVSFGIFNYVFVSGFYKTAYYYGKPFVIYCIVEFLFIAVAEVLHFLPNLGFLNETTPNSLALQFIVLGVGVLLFGLLTFFGYKKSVKSFEKIDL